ncbi:hypothetical protein AMELA_G00199500 [Ameiurus melas]|uniref:Uncharacterized protein n=1 Tax=Ameiurus melas TaxID=219545 RepID=A0A7J6A6K8_AMEME|nr:hypothetical protein AMELA_G00199500 [Ameiurus melas]
MCCNSDLCNSGPFPDLHPNGKNCYFCVGDNCLGNLQCEGLEDHCITYIRKIVYSKGGTKSEIGFSTNTRCSHWPRAQFERMCK